VSEQPIDANGYRAIAIGTALAVAPDHLPVSPDPALRQAAAQAVMKRLEDTYRGLKEFGSAAQLCATAVAADEVAKEAGVSGIVFEAMNEERRQAMDKLRATSNEIESSLTESIVTAYGALAAIAASSTFAP
jgi:hypothetical protein